MKKHGFFLWTLFLASLILFASPGALALEGMTLEKNVFRPGESMEISCYGVTEEEADGQCWVAVARRGAPPAGYMDWGFVSAGRADITLRAPSETGQYEVRFYRAYTSTEESLAPDMSVPFTVEPEKMADSVVADRSVYLPSQHMAVTCHGVTAEAVAGKAFVTVSPAGSPAERYGDWKYVTEGDCTLWLDVPAEAGNYELRLYGGSQASEENLQAGMRVPFTVSADTRGNDVPVYPTVNDFDWDILDFTPGEGSWTGTYDSSFRTLYLVQSGNAVRGEYPEWDNGRLDGTVKDGVLYAYWYEEPTYAPAQDAGQLICVLYPDGQGFRGWWRYGNSGNWAVWSAGTLVRHEVPETVLVTLPAGEDRDLKTARERNLIPACLDGADPKEAITAVEFAALGIQMFEEYWQTQELRETTPFLDVPGHSLQVEIEKAYGLGFLKRIRGERLGENGISRQLMATMLCDLVKISDFDDWSPEKDSQFSLTFEMPPLCADDDLISATARESVYFCLASGIMDCAEDGLFHPSTAATREEAIRAVNRIYSMEESDGLQSGGSVFDTFDMP